jgi:hypothetical protein
VEGKHIKYTKSLSGQVMMVAITGYSTHVSTFESFFIPCNLDITYSSSSSSTAEVRQGERRE